MSSRPAVAALLAISSCAQPLMSVPDDLSGKVDIYPAHGRQGLLLFEPQISFGPFRTISIHRGIVEEEHSSVRTGLVSSAEHDSVRQQFAFVLRGPTPGLWRGRCTAFSGRQAETLTGVHIGTDGARSTNEQTTLSEASGYVCQLDGPAAEHWTLETDAGLGEGTVRDSTGHLVAEIQGEHD